MIESEPLNRKTRKRWTSLGAAHFLTFSCYRRTQHFNRDETCLWLTEAIDAARVKHPVRLVAWVIMPEHVHLILQPTANDLTIGAVLQSIKQSVARKAAGERRRAGRLSAGQTFHFWQAGGGHDRLLRERADADRAVAYLHLNPVRRRLVEEPTDWRWSSARSYAGAADVVLQVDGFPD